MASVIDRTNKSDKITGIAGDVIEQSVFGYARDSKQECEKDLATDILDKVMEQSAAFFEHLVVDLLVKMGYGGSFADSAQVTQLSNDKGSLYQTQLTTLLLTNRGCLKTSVL